MPLFSITTTTCFNYVYIYIYCKFIYVQNEQRLDYYTNRLPRLPYVTHFFRLTSRKHVYNWSEWKFPRHPKTMKYQEVSLLQRLFLILPPYKNYPVQRVRFQAGDGWRLDRRVPNSKNTKTHGPRHSSKLQTSAEQECIASLWAWRKLNKINSFTKLQEKKHNARASRKPTHPIQRMQRMVYSWKKGWR